MQSSDNPQERRQKKPWVGKENVQFFYESDISFEVVLLLGIAEWIKKDHIANCEKKKDRH